MDMRLAAALRSWGETARGVTCTGWPKCRLRSLPMYIARLRPYSLSIHRRTMPWRHGRHWAHGHCRDRPAARVQVRGVGVRQVFVIRVFLKSHKSCLTYHREYFMAQDSPSAMRARCCGRNDHGFRITLN